MWLRNQKTPTKESIESEYYKQRLNSSAVSLIAWWGSSFHTKESSLMMLSDAQYMIFYMGELNVKFFTFGGFTFTLDCNNMLHIENTNKG